jgi:hypothetical protein
MFGFEVSAPSEDELKRIIDRKVELAREWIARRGK